MVLPSKKVSRLETIFQELKALPPDRLEWAADFIHRLQAMNQVERNAVLRNTSGIMGEELGVEFARIIQEDCEQIHECDW